MYIKITDGNAELYGFRQLRKDNPAVSFPETPTLDTLAALGIYPVTNAEMPAATESQIVERDVQPTDQGDGTYVWGWTLRNKTAEELAAEETQRHAGIQSELDSAQSVVKVLLKVSFLQENRIRVLEGKQPVTAAQFRTWVDSQIE